MARKAAKGRRVSAAPLLCTEPLDAEYERLRRQSEQDIARAKLGRPAAERFLIDTAVTGTQIAADGLANAAVPGASLALKGVRSFGDASQEARLAGATVGQQIAYGTLTAGKDVAIEKVVDGFGGAYGKGSFGKLAKTPSVKEGTEAFVSTMMQPLIQSTYSGEIDYNQSVFEDALRNAAIKGTASGIINAWNDAQNWALNKTYNTAMQPQTQAALRRNYVGSSVQPGAESYITLLKSLCNAKGSGHRW